jgi:GMP synthase-like glutamine amidotransferase
MHVHYLQHVPFEGLGSVADWAAARGHSVSATRLYAGEAVPRLDTLDGLVVMGGPMGAYDEATYPWLAGEKRCIADAIACGKRVLGICLGAQLIAAALGARVTRNRHKEIGWFPITLTEAGRQSPFGHVLGNAAEVFHWHGDTFDLPAGAVHLARSAACEHQAFSVGDRVVGLQFHLETTPAAARALVENCPDDLVAGRFVQSGEAILSDSGRFARINTVMERLLDQWSQANAETVALSMSSC